jgi:two-component system phosphate regulon sensor histidine kinase PhoR
MSPLRSAIISAFSVAGLSTFITYFMAGERLETIDLILQFTAITIISGLIVFFTTQRFLNERILPVYRTIFGLTGKKSKPKLLSRVDPLKRVEKDVLHWADERIEEIRNLQKKDDFRKEFVGNLAHELKTPLFNIQGYVSSLLEGAIDDENVNMKFLEKANNNINRMILLVEDLDNISTMESGMTQLDMRRMDVVKCCREAIDSLEEKASKRAMKIIHKCFDPIYVQADEFRIGQVFVNIINNAITYGKNGGNVEIIYTDVEDRIMVEIRDDGPGIDPAVLPRIFERFYRVDKSRSRHVGGSGLGLSIVKHIIEAHKQSVTVRSKLQKGSAFTFTLKKVK